jgi:hypothetical protein
MVWDPTRLSGGGCRPPEAKSAQLTEQRQPGPADDWDTITDFRVPVSCLSR